MATLSLGFGRNSDGPRRLVAAWTVAAWIEVALPPFVLGALLFVAGARIKRGARRGAGDWLAAGRSSGSKEFGRSWVHAC